MLKQEFLDNIWKYYLILEQDFINTFRYVGFSNDNSSTYSPEYIKQLLAIGSEVDVVCKQLCTIISPASKAEDINDYRNILKNTDLLDIKAICTEDNSELNSWISWKDDKNPQWWKDYNTLKHHRVENNNYKLGNLENVKNALSGLYILCRFLFSKIDRTEPQPHSSLFRIDGWNVYVYKGNGFYQVLRTNGNISMDFIK